MADKITVGYWLSEKKFKKMNFQRFLELCRQSGVEISPLDLRKPLELQGPFDVILHKINEEILFRAENGDPDAVQQVDNFKNFEDSHPDLPFLDRLSHTNILKDRKSLFDTLQRSLVKCGDAVFVPEYVEISQPIQEIQNGLLNSIKFPCLCKPSATGNLTRSHEMSIVYNKQGLHDVETPCVIQRFVNHSGVLFKVYIIGASTSVVTRPSIRNLTPGDFPTEHFNTHNVSKKNSSSSLNEKAPADVEPDMTLIGEIAGSVRAALGIDLLGIDVIVEEGTGHHGIIDVNSFPGFDGMPDVANEALLQLLTHRVQQSRSHTT